MAFPVLPEHVVYGFQVPFHGIIQQLSKNEVMLLTGNSMHLQVVTTAVLFAMAMTMPRPSGIITELTFDATDQDGEIRYEEDTSRVSATKSRRLLGRRKST